jgi:hypothetical protein
MSQKHLTTGGLTSERLPFGLYGLELSDGSMMPFFNPGTIFILERGAFSRVQNEDFVGLLRA